jgi:hypothetical protein
MLIHSLSVPFVPDRHVDKHVRPPTCLLNDDFFFLLSGTLTFYKHNNAGGQLLRILF